MRKFFMRNDSQIIQDALGLSLEEFVKKYRPLTEEEVLSKAYFEIIKKHKSVEQSTELSTEKKVTFKVIKTENMKQKNSINSETENLNDLPVAVVEYVVKGREGNNITEVELKSASIVVDEDLSLPVKEKTGRGRKPSANADKRDFRILELLKEGKKGKDIIDLLASEGFKVHPAQVTTVKKLHSL
jgi:hypothetical protein